MPIRPTVLPAFAVFAAAARHQNFAHAAEELHLTASAVSHHVRRLETTLGVTLFQRHARGVVLTAQGRALADATNVALADLDAVSGSLLTRDQEVARVRITTLHSLAYCWLIPRLPGFTAAHPNVHLDFETSISLARFDDAGPDLGIRHGPGPWPGLTAHYLMDDALFPVAAPTLPGCPAGHEGRAHSALAVDLRSRSAGLARLVSRSRRAWRQSARRAFVHGFHRCDARRGLRPGCCARAQAYRRAVHRAGRADPAAWPDAEGALLVLRRAPGASSSDARRGRVHRLAAPRGSEGRRSIGAHVPRPASAQSQVIATVLAGGPEFCDCSFQGVRPYNPPAAHL